MKRDGKRLKVATHLFIVGQFVTYVGDKLFNMMLALFMLERTGSAVSVGVAFALLYAGSPAGYFMTPFFKRWNPVNVLIATDLFSSGSALLLVRHAIGWDYGGLVLLGILRAINRPLSQSFVSRLATSDDTLSRLTIHSEMGRNAATIVAVAISTELVASHHIVWAILINSASFLASAIVERLLRPLYAPSPPTTEFSAHPTHLRVKLHRLIKDPFYFVLLFPNSLLFALVAAYSSQLAALAKSMGGNGLYYVVLIIAVNFAVMSVNMLFRTLLRHLMNRDHRAQLRWWLLGVLGTGVFYAATPLAGYRSLQVVFVLLAAAFDATVALLQSRMWNARVDRQYLGELFTLRFLIRNVAKAAATASLAILIQFFGLTTSLVAAGFAIVVIGVVAPFFLRVF